MTDVFISYKHRMIGRVAPIAEALRELGLEVWYDAGLVSGSDYADAISKHLRAAKCVLVCWSNDAFPHGGDKNGWVRGEAEKGRDRNALVAVMLEETDLDPPWNMVHYERLTDWMPTSLDRANWQRALNAIGAHVGRPGLGEYDKAVRDGASAGLSDWARRYAEDPLATKARARAKELYLAEAAARFEAEDAGQAEAAARKAEEDAEAERRRADQQAASERLAREAQEKAHRDAEAGRTKDRAERAPPQPESPGDPKPAAGMTTTRGTGSDGVSLQIGLAGLLGLVACAALIFSSNSAGLLRDMGPGVSISTLGTGLYGLAVVWALWRRHRLSGRKALILALAVPAIALASGWLAYFAGGNLGFGRSFGIIFGVGGAFGAVVTLAAMFMLGAIDRSGAAVRIAIATVAACGIVVGVAMANIDSGFGPDALGWIAIAWQVCFTLGLVALLRVQAVRSAKTM